MKGRISMKKSSFVTMILGTVSGMLFAIGMCMALLPEWDAFNEGIIFGGIGLAMGLVTLIVWRKMEHKAPIKISGRGLLIALVGIVGALLLGVGMCFCMIWSNMALGIVIGMLGIVALLCLIPLIKGIKD